VGVAAPVELLEYGEWLPLLCARSEKRDGEREEGPRVGETGGGAARVSV
jgi:hypothetical protein